MIFRFTTAAFCRLLLLLILPVFFTASVSAQAYIGLREVTSYSKQQYNAGAQNWDIRQDAQGRMYFANNEGLLSFDGANWKLYPLPNKTIVRSIEFGRDDRIYIGGQDEIGYFSPEATGRLVYTSLNTLLPETDRKFADIWNIVSYGNDVWFRSGTRMFRYSGGRIEVFRPENSWLFMGIDQQRLIAQDDRNGIMEFRNNQWVPFLGIPQLPQRLHITDIMPLGKDSSLITTHNHGLFVLSRNSLTPFRLSGMAIDPYQDFSECTRIDDETFILGTYNNGFCLVKKNGTILENFSRKEGLQNSNVRSLFMDRNRNIWLGLDNGIDFIAFNNAIKHINPSVANDGAGYAMIVHDNSLYLGLSNGIYSLDLTGVRDLSYEKDRFRLITTGQNWGLYVINDHLLAGKDDGFFDIQNGKAVPLIKGIGYWTFQAMQHMPASSLIAAGNYRGVRLFEYRDNRFHDKGSAGNFTESSRFLVIDNDNTIWVSHPYRGVYRIQSSAPGYTVKLYTASDGLPSALNNHIYKIKNRMVVATERGVYELNSSSSRFEPSAYYKEIFGSRSIRYLKEDPAGNIWFVQGKNIGVADLSTLKPAIIYFPELKGKILSGFENIYPVNENNIFVGGEKGVYHINYEKYRQNNRPLNVYIRNVRAIGKEDSVLFGGYFGNVNEDMVQPKRSVPSVSHQYNSFHIEYSSPLFEQQPNIEYSYYLEGFDKGWSEWSRRTEKDYTNLSAGDYVFRVKARNNFRNESEVNSFAFTVLPPWYLAVWAIALYVLAAISLAWLLYRRYRKKLLLERERHREEQKRTAYLHQLELEKSEKEVMKLRNEKLESEIAFKNSELASTAMHLVQKEEFLHKIKEELQHLNKNGSEKPDPGELKKILRIMSQEEKLNAEWEQFSVHFDKVHSGFLGTLKERYPELKAHELKLCAYLRMNLSSKEIARLMSISVRGVEISRYRVRKKLKISTETNLFQFLFDLQKNGLE